MTNKQDIIGKSKKPKKEYLAEPFMKGIRNPNHLGKITSLFESGEIKQILEIRNEWIKSKRGGNRHSLWYGREIVESRN